ncbi:hypothetical protein [Parasphingorhabdus pacifica]
MTDTLHAKIRVQTFKTERVARMNFDGHRDPESVFSSLGGPADPLGVVVGDAPAQAVTGFGGDRFYMFLAGRNVVQFDAGTLESPEMKAKFTEAAQQIAEHLQRSLNRPGSAFVTALRAQRR